jgi:hypothetical protein
MMAVRKVAESTNYALGRCIGDLMNPCKRATIRTSISYSCVPGKQEPTGCCATSVRQFSSFAEPAAQPLHFVQGVPVARIQEHYS